MMRTKDKVYCEYANGTVNFFTFAEARRIYVSEAWVRLELRRDRIRVVALEPRYKECPGC